MKRESNYSIYWHFTTITENFSEIWLILLIRHCIYFATGIKTIKQGTPFSSSAPHTSYNFMDATDTEFGTQNPGSLVVCLKDTQHRICSQNTNSQLLPWVTELDNFQTSVISISTRYEKWFTETSQIITVTSLIYNIYGCPTIRTVLSKHPAPFPV